jgi:polysaccharide biosynthesis/export protein
MENDGKMTVLQAVALAGGQTRTAAMRHVRLIRRKESNYSDTEVSLKKIMNGQESDVELQPEDVQYVPNSTAKLVVYRGVPSILQSASSAAVYSAVP